MNKTRTVRTVVDGDIFELRNINYYEELSEETYCFRAEAYFNDKLLGYAENNGKGEASWIRPCQHYKEMSTAYGKFLDKLDKFSVPFQGMVLHYDEDFLLSEMIAEFIQGKQVLILQ